MFRGFFSVLRGLSLKRVPTIDRTTCSNVTLHRECATREGHVVIKPSALVRINKLVSNSILVFDHIADDVVRTLPMSFRVGSKLVIQDPPRTFILGA
jgi:hypothetical protein